MKALLLFLVIWSLGYFRAKSWIWFVTLAILLVLETVLVGVYPVLILGWAIFLAASVLFGLPILRQRFITSPLYNIIKRALPPVSREELDNLERGTTWWEGELFNGRPEWSKLLSKSPQQLNTEEQAFLDGPVEELCAMLNDWEISEHLHDLPPDVWDFLKNSGFFGMNISKKYGGLEFSPLAQSEVIMKIASRSVVAAVTTMVPNSIGPAELLSHYGTREQKNTYLPRLAVGKEVPCFALTGVQSGSDAVSRTPDTGIVCKRKIKGQETLGIRLNVEKRYITLAPVATLLGLAFHLYDPDKLLDGIEDLGMTFALVPAKTRGITIGDRHNPLNVPFQNGPILGKNVFIPMEQVIGESKGIGQGSRMLTECLAAGRSVSLPALSTCAGKLAARGVGAYARVRTQFGLPIGRFEGVEEPLARIAGHAYLLSAARTVTCGGLKEGDKPLVISSIMKLHSTEMMRKTVNDAMDILGGKGISFGPRNMFGSLYQAIPIGITVEGANILVRSLMVFGIGALRCHPYLALEFKALTNEDRRKGLGDLDTLLFAHIGYSVSNMIRTITLALTGGRLTRAPKGPTKALFQKATRLSSGFALVADVTMLMLGSRLRRKEKISGRLGDVLSWLYLVSCVLKKYNDDGMPKEDLPLVKWACATGFHAAEESLYAVFRNYPVKIVGCFLRALTFPLGRVFPEPGDKLEHRVAKLLLSPSPSRDRLTEGLYFSEHADDSLRLLDDALEKSIAAEDAEKTIRRASKDGTIRFGFESDMLKEALSKKILSSDEGEIVRLAVEARRKVIEVDAFPHNYWSKE